MLKGKPVNCEVIVKPGEGIDSALARFKNACKKNGHLKVLKKHEFFIPKRLRLEQKRTEHMILVNRTKVKNSKKRAAHRSK